MLGKYAYSLNGQTFQGAFSSRQEAIDHALDAARRSEEGPLSVFVGKLVGGDPKTSGHARSVLAHMTSRAREEFGDSASNYLTGLPKSAVQDLDACLEKTILDWLQRNNRMPTFHKVEAVGEIPVPTSMLSPQETR